MESSNQFKEKVLAGASYLDLAQPGWAEKIDLSTLDLGKQNYCVIGQSMSGYSPGTKALGLSRPQSLALGYNCATEDYEELTRAWIPVIRERQKDRTRSRYEIEVPHTNIQYVVEIVDDGRFLGLRRVSYGEEASRIRVGTRDRQVWREIGEAFIALADNER